MVGGWDTILIIMPLILPNPFGFFPQSRVWQACRTKISNRESGLENSILIIIFGDTFLVQWMKLGKLGFFLLDWLMGHQ